MSTRQHCISAAAGHRVIYLGDLDLADDHIETNTRRDGGSAGPAT
jgi:hypothetical protein